MKSIINKLRQGLLVAMLMGSTVVTMTAPVTVSAAKNDCDLTIQGGADCAKGDGQSDSLFGDGSAFQTVTNILLFLIGAISVIMLIIGGIRYVISGGDQAQVTAAKNTILYAIVGIVVAFLAYAAVAFVTSQFNNS